MWGAVFLVGLYAQIPQDARIVENHTNPTPAPSALPWSFTIFDGVKYAIAR